MLPGFLNKGAYVLKVQAGIVIVLLAVIAALQISSRWSGMNTQATPTGATPPPAFSVTSTGEGQYVMRANDNIFFCVNNRCTTIQLITGTQTSEQPAAQPAESPQ